MNDESVKALWGAFESLDQRLQVLERRVEFLKGQVKARLKEELAEARKSFAWRYANALSGTTNAEDIEVR